MTCGCLKPNVCHHFNPDGSCADITLSDLEMAGGAAGIGVGEAANNIPRTLRQATGQSAVESFGAMLNRPQLFFDIDNTLADLSSGVVLALNGAFGTSYRVEDFTSYKWDNHLPAAQAEWVRGASSDGTLYQNLSPIQGGISTVQRAHAAGYTVRIVTDRPESTRPETEYWLNRWEVPYLALLMRGAGQPGKVTSHFTEYEMPNSVVVDDNPVVLNAAVAMGAQAWSPRWPYSPDNPGVRVFDDWHEPKRWLGV